MAGFLQAVAAALVAVILCTVLGGHGKNFALLLSLAACCMVLLTAVRFLEPVTELMETLRQTGQLDPDMLAIILKAVGIGLVGELAALICSDAGNGAIARAVEIVTAGAILWLSIPLMTALLDQVGQMAGGL